MPQTSQATARFSDAEATKAFLASILEALGTFFLSPTFATNPFPLLSTALAKLECRNYDLTVRRTKQDDVVLHADLLFMMALLLLTQHEDLGEEVFEGAALAACHIIFAGLWLDGLHGSRSKPLRMEREVDLYATTTSNLVRLASPGGVGKGGGQVKSVFAFLGPMVLHALGSQVDSEADDGRQFVDVKHMRSWLTSLYGGRGAVSTRSAAVTVFNRSRARAAAGLKATLGPYHALEGRHAGKIALVAPDWRAEADFPHSQTSSLVFAALVGLLGVTCVQKPIADLTPTPSTAPSIDSEVLVPFSLLPTPPLAREEQRKCESLAKRMLAAFTRKHIDSSTALESKASRKAREKEEKGEKEEKRRREKEAKGAH